MQRKLNAYEINLCQKLGVDAFKLSIDEYEPIEYVLQKAIFRERLFKVNKNTLIPRVETEQIIDIALTWLNSNNLNTVNFADIGTGSGCIGISFALELSKTDIAHKGLLSDISKEALEVTSTNLEDYNLKLEVIRSDLFDSINKQKFDIIFANLPYIPSARINSLNKNVKDFEPITALDGGKDGLEFIRKFLSTAHQFMHSDSLVILEVDDTHTSKYTKEFKSNYNINIEKDENGKNRFWKVKLKT